MGIASSPFAHFGSAALGVRRRGFDTGFEGSRGGLLRVGVFVQPRDFTEDHGLNVAILIFVEPWGDSRTGAGIGLILRGLFVFSWIVRGQTGVGLGVWRGRLGVGEFRSLGRFRRERRRRYDSGSCGTGCCDSGCCEGRFWLLRLSHDRVMNRSVGEGIVGRVVDRLVVLALAIFGLYGFSFAACDGRGGVRFGRGAVLTKRLAGKNRRGGFRHGCGFGWRLQILAGFLIRGRGGLGRGGGGIGVLRVREAPPAMAAAAGTAASAVIPFA